MTGFLSAISGQFTRAWILGALFPSVIFVFLFLVFVAPLLPPGFVLTAPAVFGTDWNALSVTFFTLVLSALLSSLDTQLIQLYEGYPWRHSVLGRWMTGVQRGRMEALQRRSRVLFVLAADEQTPEGKLISDAWSDARTGLVQDFPDDPGLVLPTRLGNVMRAFERYPTVQYGMDAIYLWPRLVAVIPDAYASALGGARTSLVFLLTLSYLTAVLGVVTLAAGLTYLPPRPVAHVALPALGFFVVAKWLYHRSFEAAADWGHFVKGAFDLYRGELLKKMGHQQQPLSRKEERDLWNRITYQVMSADEQVGLDDEPRPWVEYTDPPEPATSVHSVTDDVELEVTRAVDGPALLWELRVVVVIRNTGPTGKTAKNVVVVDTLPAGMAYRWKSARVNDRAATVMGTGPYRFDLGDVPAGASAILTYTASATHFREGS